MKATDLMIKDWVWAGFPRRVEEINADYFIASEGEEFDTIGYDDEDLEPIPITEDMLEMNGFEMSPQRHWLYSDDYYDLWIEQWSDSIWTVEYEDTEMETPEEKITFGYVHELQHFLRLCGCGEMADNFKV